MRKRPTRTIQLRYVPKHDQQQRIRRALAQLQAWARDNHTQKECPDDDSSDLRSSIDPTAG